MAEETQTQEAPTQESQKTSPFMSDVLSKLDTERSTKPAEGTAPPAGGSDAPIIDPPVADPPKDDPPTEKDDFEAPEGSTPKQQDYFKNARVKYQTAEKTAKDLEAKMKALETEHNEALSKAQEIQEQMSEFEALKSQRDELEAQLNELDIKRNPKISKKYDKLFSAQLEKIKTAAGSTLAEEAILAATSTRAREQLLSTLEDSDSVSDQKKANRLRSLLDRYDELEVSRETDTEDLAQNWQEQKAQKLKELKSLQEKNFKDTQKTFKAKVQAAFHPEDGLTVLQKHTDPGDDVAKIAHNKSIDEHIRIAKDYVLGWDQVLTETRADLAIYAAAGAQAEKTVGLLSQVIGEKDKEVADLKNRLKIYEDIEPQGSPSGDVSSTGEGTYDKDRPYTSRILSAIERTNG